MDDKSKEMVKRTLMVVQIGLDAIRAALEAEDYQDVRERVFVLRKDMDNVDHLVNS